MTAVANLLRSPPCFLPSLPARFANPHMPASTNQDESDQQYDPVRHLAAAGLRQLGANDDEIASIAEIILLSGGYYVGRRFECASREAVWMIDRDEVCFYQAGELVTSMAHASATPAPLPVPDRRAA